MTPYGNCQTRPIQPKVSGGEESHPHPQRYYRGDVLQRPQRRPCSENTTKVFPTAWRANTLIRTSPGCTASSSTSASADRRRPRSNHLGPVKIAASGGATGRLRASSRQRATHIPGAVSPRLFSYHIAFATSNKTPVSRPWGPRARSTIVFSPGLRCCGDVQPRRPSDHAAGLDAVYRHRRRVVRQIVHLQIDAAFRQVHVGRNRHAAAERIGRLHGTQGQRPRFMSGVGGSTGGFGSRTSAIGSRIGFVSGSIRMGRAIFSGWNTSSTVSSGSRVSDTFHRFGVDPAERERRDFVSHGVPAFRLAAGGHAELELLAVALMVLIAIRGRCRARPSDDAARAASGSVSPIRRERSESPAESPASAERTSLGSRLSGSNRATRTA